MPDALAALSELGVSIGAADSFPFRGIRFLDRGTAVEASFPAGCARGVRRTTLHRMMIEEAEAFGVQLRWGARGTWALYGAAGSSVRTVRIR